MNGSNLFGQVIPEIQMPFPNFQEAQKPQEQLQNIYGNLKLQVFRLIIKDLKI